MARTYTPLRFDPAACELDVEFVLHGDGPAASWASTAAVGQALSLAGPGRGYTIEQGVDWYLIVVDQTAFAAAATILRDLPTSTRATVIVEVADEAEERELPSKADVTWAWVRRNGQPAGDEAGFLQALMTFEPPGGRGAAYAGADVAVVRRIRR